MTTIFGCATRESDGYFVHCHAQFLGYEHGHGLRCALPHVGARAKNGDFIVLRDEDVWTQFQINGIGGELGEAVGCADVGYRKTYCQNACGFKEISSVYILHDLFDYLIENIVGYVF